MGLNIFVIDSTLSILFGSIGTLVETSEIQRKSYNLAFEKVGVGWYWNTATYCTLLAEPGGLKRIRKFANNSLSEDKIQSIHFYKEKFFTELIPGTLYLRPTVIDVIRYAKNNGIKLGFMSFFVKACIVALKNFPSVNAEIEGDEIIYKNYYNISFAVGTEKGLVVPVLKNSDELSFSDIEKNIKEISEKAREGKLTIEDLQGGTFTISNGGVYGSMLSTPILNLPQSGVLGMHNIVDRPTVVDGEIKIRPIMYLALSYDHRIIDGKESVSFLKMIKENLEDPRRLFLDI